MSSIDLSEQSQLTLIQPISAIHFTVPGSPVAKGRARAYQKGNYISHVTPEKTVMYENLIKIIAIEAMNGAKPIEGAIQLRIQAHFPIAESWSKKKKEEAITGILKCTKKPDADNIAKVISDALNGVAYADDSAITVLVVTKGYSIEPRVEVQLDKIP
jgi:Holliday junction resolvase RusA-like endonuclease